MNHDGRGWWDPLSAAKGDIFSLIQYLEPGLDFAEARRRLRGLAGMASSCPEPAPDPRPAARPSSRSAGAGNGICCSRQALLPGAT